MNLIVVFTLIVAVCELEALRLEEKTPENDNELVYKEAEADFDATGNQDFSLAAPTVSKAISKRGFTQFGLMILRVLKRNPFDYNGYGCWCGLGGKGLPVDGTDRCCKEHDKCYSKLNRKKICKGNQVFFVRYFFKGTKCLKFPPTSRCGKGACKCDSKAVKCFRRNKRTFNRKYKNWNRKKCKKPFTTTWKSCL